MANTGGCGCLYLTSASQNSTSPYAKTPSSENEMKMNQKNRIHAPWGTFWVQNLRRSVYNPVEECRLRWNVHHYHRNRGVLICQDSYLLQSTSAIILGLPFSERLTHRYQYAHPRANPRAGSTNLVAYSVNDPDTGIKVASSPRDCL